MQEQRNHSHHTPFHLFIPGTMYIVTASTLYKQHFFHDAIRLQMLNDTLLQTTATYGWQIQAWAVFSNHYHFIARSPEDPTTLKRLIQRLHSQTARELNIRDAVLNRQVWFQYWDTCLIFEKSYYARLNYVHNNAVRHGLVQVAEKYAYCSASWFKAAAEQTFQKKVTLFRYDQIAITDDF